MRSNVYIALATALCWSAQGAILDKNLQHGDNVLHRTTAAGSRTVTHAGSQHKNSSSAAYRKQHESHLEIRQAGNGACGPSAGRCPNDLCCSSYGFCGDSVDRAYIPSPFFPLSICLGSSRGSRVSRDSRHKEDRPLKRQLLTPIAE